MTCCFRAPKEDEESIPEGMLKEEFEAIKESMSSGSYSGMKSLKNTSYVRYLERQNQYLQSLYFNRSTEIARLQSYLRQIIQSAPGQRYKIINELKHKPFKEIGAISRHYNMLPTLEQHNAAMGDIKLKQQLLIRSLRQQIGSLQKASQNLPKEGWLSKERGNDSKISLTKQISECSQDKNPVIGRTLETQPIINYESSDISSTNQSMESSNTLCGSVIAARSSSFKELRDMYQKNLRPVLKY